jgi:hypothetical protein
VLAAWLALQGCQTRGFNKASVRNTAAAKTPTAAGWKDAAEFPLTHNAVTNYSALTDKKNALPANYNEDRLLYTGFIDVDNETAITPYNVQYTEAANDVGAKGRLAIDDFRTPQRYQNGFMRARTERALPRVLAKQMALNALNKMAEAWFEYTPSSPTTPQTEPKVKNLAQLQAISQGSLLMTGNYFKDSYSDGAGCIGNKASHWNDLTMHYYCNLPGDFRYCYSQAQRGLVSSTSRALSEGRTPAVPYEKHRETVVSLCSDPDAISTFAKNDDVFASNLVSPEEAARYAELFKFFIEDENNFIDDGQGNSVNIFKFMMFQQTYAFSYEDQQDVVNAFYAQFTDKGSFAHTGDECYRARPTRATDLLPESIEDGQGGILFSHPYDHCLASKRLNTPLIGQGR